MRDHRRSHQTRRSLTADGNTVKWKNPLPRRHKGPPVGPQEKESSHEITHCRWKYCKWKIFTYRRHQVVAFRDFPRTAWGSLSLLTWPDTFFLKVNVGSAIFDVTETTPLSHNTFTRIVFFLNRTDFAVTTFCQIRFKETCLQQQIFLLQNNF